MATKKLSKEAKWRLGEYQKCKKDLFYFIEHFVRLEEGGGSSKPHLYPPQKQFLDGLNKDHYIVLLKTRQTGGSTAAQMYCAWACVFFEGVTVGVVSRKGDESTDFCRKVMTMIKSLPNWMTPEFDKSTERTFILANQSKFYAEAVVASNPGSLFRGKSITIAIIDEASFINYIDTAYTSFAPTLFKAHQVAEQKGIPYAMMIISTPNRTVGIGKWYYDMWKKSNEGQGIYKPYKLYWKDIPEFRDDPKWYKTQCDILRSEGGDDGKIKQELEMQFVGSDDSWLPLDIISQLNEIHIPPKQKMYFQGGELWIWDELDMEKHYIIGIDTASASGGSNSAVQVYDYTGGVQVAEFRGKLEVFEFIEVIQTISKLYPNNTIVPENNSYGLQVIETLIRSENYYNVYIQTKTQKPTKINVQQGRAIANMYGINTNNATRPLIMDSLYTFITQNPAMVRSERLALELVGLVEKVSATMVRVQADEGATDDLCLSLAFICYLLKYDPPMDIPISMSEGTVNVLNDVMTVTGWNEEEVEDLTGQRIPFVKLPEKYHQQTRESINKQIGKLVKDRYHDLSDNGDGAINVLDVLDMNDL